MQESSLLVFHFRFLVNIAILRTFFIGAWCNGNTTDFGSVIIGSNPIALTTKFTKTKIKNGY